MKPILKYRTEKGLSLRDLASKTNLTNQYISQVELNQIPQSMGATLKMAKGLDLSIDYLTGTSGVDKPLTETEKLFIQQYETLEEQLKILNKGIKTKKRAK